jgi:hypothetical protein
MPVVRDIERAAAKNDNRFTSIVMGIVTSTPFQMRRVEQGDTDAAAANGNKF